MVARYKTNQPTMTYNSRFEHTTPLFRKYKLLKEPNIIKLQTCLFAYNTLNTSVINCGFQITLQKFGTRLVYNLQIPHCRTAHAQKSVI